MLARIALNGRARDPRAVDRHDPRPGDGLGAEGQRRPSGHGDGARAARLHAVRALPAGQPAGHRVARPRPLRAQLRPRLRAAVLAAAPVRLRALARGPRAVPPVGLAHARAPRARTHAGHRGDDRAARAGRRQRRRHGDRRALPRRALQPPRARDRRPPHVRDLLRRRPDGGDQPGGGVDRRALRPRQADRSATTTTASRSTARPRSPSTPRTTSRASPPRAGTCRASRTPRTSTS